MDKYEILKEVIAIESPNIHNILKEKEKYGGVITYEGLVYTLSLTKYNLAKELGCCVATVNRTLRAVFPNRPVSSSKVCNWLLGSYGLKQCKRCERVLWFEDFNLNKRHAYGLNCYCRECHCTTNAMTQNARQSKYRSKKLQRTPKWAELEDIALFYKACPNGMVVDHIVPLQGELVSGLHVLGNLQYLTQFENCSKHNKFVVD